MIRRSLIAFLAFVMLVLALIVGYALSGLSGPESAVHEAQAALAAGRTHDAIRVLDLAERNLGPEGHDDLRRTILTLRSRAYLAMDNTKQALRDLQRLTEVYAVGDVDILHEFLRALIVLDRPDEALKKAKERLHDAPDDGRTLELAGEAAQAAYQAEMKELLGDLATKLSPELYRQAVDDLQPYLYRDAADPLGRHGSEQFDELLKKHRREAYVANLYRPQIDQIREGIRTAQDFFRRSLQRPGSPVSAYQGLAYALRQGRRFDDVLALSEVYLRRFEHIYTTEAAVALARVHYEHGRYRAAVAAADRFLRPGTLVDRLRSQTISDAVRRLLLYKARALHAMAADVPTAGAARTAMASLVQEVRAATEAGLDPGLEEPLIEAYAEDVAGKPAAVESILGPYSWDSRLADPPTTGDDLLAEAMHLRLHALESMKSPVGPFRFLCKTWIQRRPGDAEPYRIRAEALLNVGSAAEALPDARDYLELMGHDDHALQLFAAAVDGSLVSTGRSSESLLRECLQLHFDLPREVTDNTQYMQLSELAYQKKQYWIAMSAARRASQLFTWAKWPRLLLARAALAQHEPQAALRAMEALREYHEVDAEALDLLRQARLAAGQSTDDLLYEIALTGQPDEEVAASLLRNCMRRRDWPQAQRFAVRIARAYGRSPAVRIMVADTMIAAGQPQPAHALLTPMFEPLMKNHDPLAAEVARRLIGLEADAGHAGAVAAMTPITRDLHRGDPEALVAITQRLVKARMFASARDMLAPVLDDERHKDFRTGAHYLLAGRLDLAAGDLERAEEHLTAAAGFDDGQEAQLPLALLLLREDRTAEAAEAFWQPVTDETSAALAIRLGKPDRAKTWINQTLTTNITDLAAGCLRRYVVKKDKNPPVAFEKARDLLLDVLLFAEADGFEEHALERARELASAVPDDPLTTTLLGHALARAGHIDEALKTLRPVADKRGYAAAWDEIVRILGEHDPARLDSPDILKGASEVVQRNERAAPPRLRALTTRALVKTLSSTDKPPAATLDLLATLWTRYAEETRAGLGEFQFLMKNGRHADAFRLLEIIERRLPADERPGFVTLFASTARSLLRTTDDAELRTKLLQRAEAMLKQDGAYGGLVHLILEQRDRVEGPLPERLDEKARARIADERNLLDRHLAHFREGLDADVPALVDTMRRFAALDGPAVALDRIELMLRWDPSLIQLWLYRADLLEADGQPREALRGLSWLFSYTMAPELLLTHGRIAARAGIATPKDDMRLQRHLEAKTAASPEAAYVLGLMALRMARYPQAAELLAKAAPQPDGAHLFYRALALLAQPDPGTSVQAAELLADLDHSYPKSRVSEIAGNLAQQLALGGAEASTPAADTR